uniref:SET domain-containing protein n=1 Tax=Rhabditophanes sp. KR3021 TaxID=114890 RepID=A0AC35U206_9BILA
MRSNRAVPTTRTFDTVYADNFLDLRETFDTVEEHDIFIGENLDRTRFFVARICRINYHEGQNTDRVFMEGVVTLETVLDHEAHAKLEHMFKRNSHLYAILKKKADLKLIKMQPFAPTLPLEIKTLIEIRHIETLWRNQINRYKPGRFNDVYLMNTVDGDVPNTFSYDEHINKEFKAGSKKNLQFKHFDGCRNCSAKTVYDGCEVVMKWFMEQHPDFQKADLNTGKLIFECNDTCSCFVKTKKHCANRVSCFPRSDKTAIVFRTPDTGFGLATGHALKKGAFFSEYVGKIEKITSKNIGVDSDNSYTYELDHAYTHYEATKKRPGKFMLNAKYHGNISRFANHSCNPNLRAVSIFGGIVHNNFHKIFFAAKKDIEAYEELTIRYFTEPADPKECHLCHCKEQNCIKYLPIMDGKYIK